MAAENAVAPTSTSTTIKTSVYSRNLFSPEEADLYELTQLAGITIDSHVFKIVTDLLRLNVPPPAIVRALKKMCVGSGGQQQQQQQSSHHQQRQRRHVDRNSGSSDGGSSKRTGSDKSPSIGSTEMAAPRPRLPSNRSVSASSLSASRSQQEQQQVNGIPPRGQ